MTMTKPEEIRLAALAQMLRGCSIFSGLGESDLLQIAGYSERILLDKGELLFREGDPVLGFYVVLRGTIQAYRMDGGGREQVIHLISAGGSFAEPAVAGLPGYPAHTKAVESTEVVLVKGEPFLEHLRLNSELSLRMLSSLSRHLHELVGTIEGYRLKDAETRLLHWLLGRTEGREGLVVFELAVPKSVLASELGTRQETLSRMLARLRRAGLVRVEGRKITVVDSGELRQRFDVHLKKGEVVAETGRR